MPDTPRLSSLPDFLPIGADGSPERRACALGTFTDPVANAALVRHFSRGVLLATTTQHTAPPAPVLVKAASNDA